MVSRIIKGSELCLGQLDLYVEFEMRRTNQRITRTTHVLVTDHTHHEPLVASRPEATRHVYHCRTVWLIHFYLTLISLHSKPSTHSSILLLGPELMPTLQTTVRPDAGIDVLYTYQCVRGGVAERSIHQVTVGSIERTTTSLNFDESVPQHGCLVY